MKEIMSKGRQTPEAVDFTVEHNGAEYRATYTIEGGVMTVRYRGHRNDGAPSGIPKHEFAQRLLLEIIRDLT
ncbi:hypothetical protein [Polyangium jinanense]|uniref:Uncharacterized protein n=1 Tax=Polyangium jinanense TaxID=2829994 RepID=A0A9X4B098_9BACT|nr:hypothetical protein [Polyangium jinanense]MDC3962871.1 hypothetical protein [Polyangium jinanense]MDC3989255.1 hypothetical protein [Polyangium jinanense]